jgi:hypothetical protein
MYVFQRALEFEFAALDFRQDGVQAASYLACILAAYDASLGEHGGMCLARGDILSKQVPVDLNGSVDILEQLIGRLPESAAPHFVGHGGLARETVP